MWKTKYRNESDSMVRDYCRPELDLPTYEIVFDFEGERYYFYADAANLKEALGVFFVLHDDVTYNHIVEHFEI